MRVKTLCSVMLGLGALALSATALAEEPPAAPPPAAGEVTPPPVAATTAPAPAAMSDSKMRIGINVVPMPFLGKFKTSLGDADAAFAFGVMPTFDYAINHNFFVGLGPLYTFNVKGKDSMGDAAKELDIMLRVGGGAPVTDKIGVYGYASPGYSIIMPPSGDSPKGFVVGFHGGGMMDVASNVFVNAEVGYQIGFQKVSVAGTSFDTKTNYLQIGLGVGMRL